MGLHLLATLACGQDRVLTSLLSLATSEVRTEMSDFIVSLCFDVNLSVSNHQAVSTGGTGGRMWCLLSSFGDPQ